MAWQFSILIFILTGQNLSFAALPADCKWHREFAASLPPSDFAGAIRPTSPEKATRVLINKQSRELFLLQEQSVLSHFRISLGFDPIGHKQQKGDGRTPEGRYFITFKKPNSNYYRGLKISYPDSQDLEWAKKQGVDPGGEIFIHGLPVNPKEKSQVEPIHGIKDWTFGCVAVTDAEIEQVWNLVELGTPVDICPRWE